MAPTGGVGVLMLYLGFTCVFLQFSGVVSIEDSVQHSVTAPRIYTAFTGGIPVLFSVDKSQWNHNGCLLEVVSLGNQTTVYTKEIPSRVPEGELTLQCGTIDHAGDFIVTLRLKATGEKLAETDIIKVSWPDFTIYLPRTHRALTGNVTGRISTNAVDCESKHPDSSYWYELAYFGRNQTKGDAQPLRVIQRTEVKTIGDINKRALVFGCENFDQAGIYKILFKSAYNVDVAMGSSNAMVASWSTDYSVRSQYEHILPCNRFLIVQYTQPRCTGDSDKIRLFKEVPHTNSSVASPTDLVYITERRASSTKEMVTFDCELFHESIVKYCLKYISTASNGAVEEQAMACLPTVDAADLVVAGGWSEWSDWGSCSASCGVGLQNRFRACDNPPPANGGNFCEGSTSEFRDCNTSCLGFTTIPPRIYTPAPNCYCGCHMTATEGKIVTSLSCHGSILWTVQVQPGHIIQLTFEQFNLDRNNRDSWVKVRNGDSHMADLLLHNAGPMSEKQTVRSTGSSMFIEYMAPDKPGMDGYEVKNEGFVAIYSSQVGNGTGAIATAGDDRKKAAWASTVTLIGIAICIIIILATVAFVCHHRVTRKKRQRKQLAANQALLSNGEVPNSPSHSGQSVQGSTNVSFNDPMSSTTNPTKRDYILAKGSVGVTTHPGPVKPSLSKGTKSKPPPGGRELSQPVESPHSRQSSISSKHASGGTPGSAGSRSIPSPYAANAKHGDYKHDPKLFDSSVLKDKGQRHHGRQKHGRRRSSPSPPPSPHRHSSQQPPSAPRDKSCAPMADLEDLSPTTPTTPLQGRSLASPSRSPRKYGAPNMGAISENIQMDSLYDKSGRKKARGIADTDIDMGLAERPPVEGRDSLTRKKGKPEEARGKTRAATPVTTRGPTTPDLQNANYMPMYPGKGRPIVKPLPLRSIERPDGQSPEARPGDPNANTPTSMVSSEMSPILQKTTLFPDSQSRTSSDIIVPADDFEYLDDYVPNLPGSYFTMDPTAYTLTWSQQPPWAQKNLQASRTTSQASVDPDRRSRGSLC